MTCTLQVAWDDRLIGYDFGPGHPLAPIRVDLTMALARFVRRAGRCWGFGGGAGAGQPGAAGTGA